MTLTLTLLTTAPTVATAAGWWTSHQNSRRLRARLRTDALTGLANRDGLALAARHAAEKGPAVGLLLLDLDGFKGVNDGYGHAEGNAVLRHVADRLTQVARPGEVPARLHGDEFAVLLGPLPHGDRGWQLATGRAADLADAIGEPLCTVRAVHRVSASVGAAVLPAERAALAPLLAQADTRMYAAKGRTRRPSTRDEWRAVA